MTREELRQAVFEAVARLAQEAALASLSPKARLRDDLDLDSFDFVQLITAIDERLGITVPEVDYGKLETLEGCLDYLEAKLRAAPAKPA